MPKYLFLDWSGDVGFKFGRGSSEYLVPTLVSVDNYGQVREGLRRLRKNLGLPPHFEFHYNQTHPRFRAAFFAELSAMPFQAGVLIVHKPSLPFAVTKMREQERLGIFVANLILRVEPDLIEKSLLLVDGQRKDTALAQGIRVAIARALERSGRPRRLRKVKTRPARSEDGLQIADMIAGTVVSRLQGRHHYLDWVGDRVSIWRYEPK